MNGKQSKVAIVSVLQNVFNEMQGFSGSNPFLADLERKLTEEGKYNLFGSIIFFVGLTLPRYRFSKPSASLDMNLR